VGAGYFGAAIIKLITKYKHALSEEVIELNEIVVLQQQFQQSIKHRLIR
jgi:hypothetical protein